MIEIRGGVADVIEERSSLFASRGFITLALGAIPPNDSGSVMAPPYIELEYFEEAAEWLRKYPKVIPGGIGLYGNSSGSLIALLLASLRSDVIKAVVSVSPLPYAGLFPFKYRGKLSEVIHCDRSKIMSTEDGLVIRDAHALVVEDNGSDFKFSAITPCEDISCPVLLIYGTDDMFMNAEYNVRLVYEKMDKNGKGHLCSVLRYPGAGHIIEPPYIPICLSSLVTAVLSVPFGDPYMVWGGELQANAHAHEDAWPKVLAFLRKNIAH